MNTINKHWNFIVTFDKMLKKILGTTGARLLTSVIAMLILVINSNTLGREGVGTIGLIIFSILIVVMFSNFAGGSILVYLAPRYNSLNLMLPSWTWSVLMSVTCVFILDVLGLLPEGYFIHIMMIGLLEAVSTANLSLLVGKERIRTYNLIAVAQHVALLVGILLFYFGLDSIAVISFVWAKYISNGLAVFLSMIAVSPYLGDWQRSALGRTIREMLKYGTYVQMAAVLHLLNLRLNYFFIDSWTGRGALGVYDINSKINDGIWLPGRSIALVQYAAIANNEDPDYARSITLSLWKVLMSVTFILALILSVLPGNFYTFIFGKEFVEVKRVLLIMIPGVFAMSSNIIIAHFFSGRGKHYMNTIGSAIGLVLTVAFGIWLIPEFGLDGAAVTTAVSYLAVSIYSLTFFIRMSGAKLKDLMLRREDIGRAMDHFRNR